MATSKVSGVAGVLVWVGEGGVLTNQHVLKPNKATVSSTVLRYRAVYWVQVDIDCLSTLYTTRELGRGRKLAVVLNRDDRTKPEHSMLHIP